MSLQKYQARVSEHTLLKGRYQWVIFELIEPKQLEFQAGQFIMLNVPGMEAKRSYSIASNPNKMHQIDILVDVSPQGDGSLFLQSLNPGEEITFMAPGGQFVLADDPEEEKLILVATGSGISAIRSMVLNLLQTKQDTRPISLHWGLRFAEDIFWEEDFRILEKQFNNFHFDLVLSRAPKEWPMCSGYVTNCVLGHYQELQKTGFYLCGKKRMIQDLTQKLQEKGVDKTHIHHEQFY